MDLALVVRASSLETTYNRVRQLLRHSDGIIFQAMATVTRDRRRPFEPPTSPEEHGRKHEEILGRLRNPRLLGGREVAFRLMEEIARRAQAQGEALGLDVNRLFSEIVFETNSAATVRLNPELRWVAEWRLPSPSAIGEPDTRVQIQIYSSETPEIVPRYVVECVGSALTAYQQGMRTAAIALLAIAVEATLRDLLKARGYSFDPRALSVDTFCQTPARVGTSGTSYTLTFDQPMPREADRFLESCAGAEELPIKIRRVVNTRKNRIDLTVIAPPSLIDHWSSDRVEQAAQKRVNGLGEALDVARNKERFLSPEDLTPDFDDVIKAVRDNLVHLSGEALETRLPALDQGPDFTLRDFLQDEEMVFDLVRTVLQFINREYTTLNIIA